MRIFWIAILLLFGCAHAAAPAIPDTEPDVTLQVATLLAQLGQGTLPADRLTDKALATMTPQLAAALRACPVPSLQLLARTTKGEDRNYLYRALCPATPLLVEIDFNKAAKINHLAVRPEH